MKLTIIDDLLKTKPKKRQEIIMAMHHKNIAHFRATAPAALAESLARHGTGRFELQITEPFMEIIDRKAGATCHPPGRLLEYTREFGSWHHTAWHDRLSVTHHAMMNDEHSEIRSKLFNTIYERVPKIREYWQSGQVVLPKLKDGRRYSGTTIFLGVATGLHIVQYLNTTVLKDAIFVEPDFEYFALSCFFLDYAALHRRFGRLVLHVGSDLPENPIDYLVMSASVTSAVWLRMLPAYPSNAFDDVIRRVSIRWNAFHEIRVPFDRELRNLGYGAKNLQSGLPVLASKPQLSAHSRIVVVGSGPSLDNLLPWLRENQDRLIILCAHSAARVLKKAGVRPDFYCTLDTEIEDELLKKLDMDPTVPIIAYYKADPKVFAAFEDVLLFHEENKANVVDFNVKLEWTHPTTGNTAVALACFFHPSVIYLAGLDLGFREASRSHAAGTWHDDEGGAGHQATLASDVLPAEPNFEESRGKIFTYSYLNNARAATELAFKRADEGTQVFNLSDGIRIAGAQPAHAESTPLDPYPEKQADVAAIHAAFSRDAASTWKPYARTASQALEGMRRDLMASIEMKEFDWLQFARAIDDAWTNAIRKSVEEGNGDFRVEAFSKLIHDLLMDWYRALCHTRTKSEADHAYRAGLDGFRAALQSLSFGAELEVISEVPVATPQHASHLLDSH